MGGGSPGVDGSQGRGVWREGRAGLGLGVGRGGFPEPRRCGAQGPDVQPEEGVMGWPGRDATAAPALSPASAQGGSRPGQGGAGVPIPGATGAARVRAKRRAE